jgi:hypothetical protein
MLKRISWTGVLLLLMASAFAQPAGFDRKAVPLKSSSVIADKNFYLFTLFRQLPEVSRLLQQQPALQARLENTRAALAKMQPVPAKEAPSFLPYFVWSSGAIDTVGKELLSALRPSPAWPVLVRHMRRSGYYALYAGLPDTALLLQAWQDAAVKLGRLVQQYTTNKGFRYPAIDSASYAAGSSYYTAMLKETFVQLQHRQPYWRFFFEPSLQLALDILLLNNRDEAARFEPMDSTNQAAYKRIAAINWDKYPYSVILLPGEGPENNFSLSPMGKYRCQLGAEQFRKGKAPFIVVSGGFVHPFQTPYCEAEEMKKYLVNELGVPAGAVIMEPHARHTTTNIRNVNRIVLRKGMPANKKILCTSTSAQTTYIATVLGQRCRKELGYVPFRDMQQLDAFNTAYYPEYSSLQLDAGDPLDP